MSDHNGNGSLFSLNGIKTVGFPIVAAFACGFILYRVIMYLLEGVGVDAAQIKSALEVQPDGSSKVLQTIQRDHMELRSGFNDFKDEMINESKKQTKLQALMCTFQAKTQKQLQECLSVL